MVWEKLQKVSGLNNTHHQLKFFIGIIHGFVSAADFFDVVIRCCLGFEQLIVIFFYKFWDC